MMVIAASLFRLSGDWRARPSRCRWSRHRQRDDIAPCNGDCHV